MGHIQCDGHGPVWAMNDIQSTATGSSVIIIQIQLFIFINLQRCQVRKNVGPSQSIDTSLFQEGLFLLIVWLFHRKNITAPCPAQLRFLFLIVVWNCIANCGETVGIVTLQTVTGRARRFGVTLNFTPSAPFSITA
jgi:hypothetical protein